MKHTPSFLCVFLIVSLFLVICASFVQINFIHNVKADPSGTETIRPEGDGSKHELEPATSSNWQLVDDTGEGDGDTTRVYTPQSTAYKTDSYETEDFAVGGIIDNVTVYIRVRSESITTHLSTWYIVIKTSSEYTHFAGTPSNAYTLYSYCWTANPNSSAWTTAAVNAMEIGAKGKSAQYPIKTGPFYIGYCTQVYAVVGYHVETEPPTYSDMSANASRGNEPCLAACKAEDNTDLCGYYFCSNNTGTATNSSFKTLSSNPAWMNETITLNNTLGCKVHCKWYFNDTSNNWNVTEILSIDIVDVVIRPNADGDYHELKPELATNYQLVDEAGEGDGDSTRVYTHQNTTLYKKDLYERGDVLIAADVTANLTLYMRVRSASDTYKSKWKCVIRKGTSEQYGSIEQPSTSYELKLKVWASNPFAGNAEWNQSEINALQIGVSGTAGRQIPDTYYAGYCTQVYMLITQVPVPEATVYGKTANDTAGQQTTFYSYWEGGTPSHYIFGINHSSVWVNTTYAFSGSSWGNVTLTLNVSAGGTTVQWEIWANNTVGKWGTTGLQSFWCWKPLPYVHEYEFGVGYGGSKHNGAIYYNGTDGGTAAIYICFSNSSVTPWTYNVAGYDINTRIWTDAFVIGNAAGNDLHWNPVITVLPDGRLIALYSYNAQMKYRISTYNASTESNLTKLVSNWGIELFDPYSSANSYPDPLRWNDKLIVFLRSGTSEGGNWSYATWNTTSETFNDHVELLYFNKPASDTSLYAYATKHENNILLGFSRREYAGNNTGVYMIYSPDKGVTWKLVNGTTLSSLPINGSLCLCHESDHNTITGAPIIDENNHVLIPCHKRVVESGTSRVYYNAKICQYNSTLGTTGSWSYNYTRYENNTRIFGQMVIWGQDPYYGTPSAWASIENTTRKIHKLVRVPNTTFKFRVIWTDNDTTDNKIPATHYFCNIVDAPESFEALMVEEQQGLLSHLDLGSEEQMTASVMYGVKLTATTSGKLLGARWFLKRDSTTGIIFDFAVYNTTLHKVADATQASHNYGGADFYGWTDPATLDFDVVQGTSYWLVCQVSLSDTYFFREASDSQTYLTATHTWGVAFPDTIESPSYDNYTFTIMGFSSRLVVRGLGRTYPIHINIGVTQTFTTAWNILAQSTFSVPNTISNSFSWFTNVLRYKLYTVNLAQSISALWTVLAKTNFVLSVSNSFSTVWNILSRSNFNIITTQAISNSWNTLTHSNFMLGVSQALSTSWNILAQWQGITDITQQFTSSWNLLVQWTSITDLPQSLSTTWTTLIQPIFDVTPAFNFSSVWQVLTTTTFNIANSLTNSFSWLVDTTLAKFYTVNLEQGFSTSWMVLTQWNVIADFSQSLSASWTVLVKSSFNIVTSLSNTFTWLVNIVHVIGAQSYTIDLAQTITTSWMVLAQSVFAVDFTQSLSTLWTVLAKLNLTTSLSQSLTATWTVLTQSNFNIATSLSNTFSWLVDAVHYIGAKQYLVDLSQTVSASWNVLTSSSFILNLSQSVSTIWTVLTQWNVNVDVAQALATTWTLLIHTSFNITSSLSNTFTWLLDVVYTYAGIDYIVDLTHSINTAWNVLVSWNININIIESLVTAWTILTSWNATINVNQTLTTVWTVLTQVNWNITSSLSNTFTWTVDVYHWIFTGYTYHVDLTLQIITSWLVETVSFPIQISISTKISLGLVITVAITLFALIVTFKKGKDKYEEEE